MAPQLARTGTQRSLQPLGKEGVWPPSQVHLVPDEGSSSGGPRWERDLSWSVPIGTGPRALSQDTGCASCSGGGLAQAPKPP